ncbi:ABC transporter permease subunit [Labrys monachus]|uniref:Spermidine/putrescine transport system permease protein n=1 Tax=Labrys monachus TaxID=217067 RepID=A0ABU0F7Y3_9HYPH|nr:ABC transporter permease subunit [Labrys monachus]MDQ0390254.1 spermidine/putrescine transport system permease protein [Labrys monachus]
MSDIAEMSAPAMQAARPRIGLKLKLAQLPLFAWLALIVVLPNLLLIATSFLSAGGGRMKLSLTLANYTRLWESAGFWRLLGSTLQFSLSASLLGAVLAYPMAYFVGRMVTRHKALLTVLVLIPLWISLLMRVFSWRLILGQSGLLNSLLVTTGILSEPSQAFLYTPATVVLTFAYISIPYIFISTLNAFEKIPTALIEASQDSGATAFQTFCHVIWPLTRRSLAIGISLAFLVTVGDYVTPAMIGGINGTTLGVLISSQFGMANNWPFGAAVSVVLILSVAAILAVLLWLCPTRGVFSGDESQDRKTAADGGGGTSLASLAGGLGYTCVITFLYAPLILMVIFSFGASTLQSFPITDYTLHWYDDLSRNTALLAAAQRSLIVAACVVIFSTTTGTGFALALHYQRMKGARAIEMLLTLPLAMPAVVLGVVMVLGTEILAIPSGLIRAVIGQSSFVMPVTLLLVLARLRRLDPSLMEASLDLGAGRLSSFAHVLLPLVKGAVISGALLGLTLSADDVMVTLFLAGPQQTLPIWVFNQMRFGFTPSVNAVFTILGLSCLLLVVVASIVRMRSNPESR